MSASSSFVVCCLIIAFAMITMPCTTTAQQLNIGGCAGVDPMGSYSFNNGQCVGFSQSAGRYNSALIYFDYINRWNVTWYTASDCSSGAYVTNGQGTLCFYEPFKTFTFSINTPIVQTCTMQQFYDTSCNNQSTIYGVVVNECEVPFGASNSYIFASTSSPNVYLLNEDSNDSDCSNVFTYFTLTDGKCQYWSQSDASVMFTCNNLNNDEKNKEEEEQVVGE